MIKFFFNNIGFFLLKESWNSYKTRSLHQSREAEKDEKEEL
jgi:hypothetical protein